jgi:hypothetical protein
METSLVVESPPGVSFMSGSCLPPVYIVLGKARPLWRPRLRDPCTSGLDLSQLGQIPSSFNSPLSSPPWTIELRTSYPLSGFASRASFQPQCRITLSTRDKCHLGSAGPEYVSHTHGTKSPVTPWSMTPLPYFLGGRVGRCQ